VKPASPTWMVRDERGIVLVSAMLFILLASIMVIGFMAAATGERSISSNAHVAKGALYSADAGVRVAQQNLATIAQTKIDSLVNLHTANGGVGPVIPQPLGVFPSGLLVVSSTNPPFITAATIHFADRETTATSQAYNYRYEIRAEGTRGGQGMRRVESSGILRVSASRGSFADYLIFTDRHNMANGADIWFTSDGHFDGRVHTNTIARIAYAPTFEDVLSSVDPQAWFYNGGNPKKLDADGNPPRDVPDLFGGFQRGALNIPLPTNSFNQQNAALGISGAAPSSNTLINQKLGTSNGTTPPPNGIYLPNDGSSVTGGIYVQGNVDQMTARIDSLGRQVYVIRQSGTTKTITIDRTGNRTYVSEGGTTTAYAGAPHDIAYVNGQLDGLGGPPRAGNTPSAAIADGEKMLFAASGDVVLSNDLTYRDYENGESVVGIFSSGGKVRIGTSCPNDMYLDAYVMAAGATGEFTVDNWDSGGPRGTFHLRGGMVAEFYGAFYRFNSSGQLLSGYGRDFHYDRRGLIPPYYPTTSLFITDQPSARTVVWKEI
jgi:Tfp pilus assembly protein PilX